MTTDVDVVVFDEDELVGKLRVTHHLCDLLQHPLARVVARMCFAGEDELHRTLRVVDHGRKHFNISQNQISSFVCGKAAGKSDRERIRTEYPGRPSQTFRRLTPALCLFHRAAADKFEKP